MPGEARCTHRSSVVRYEPIPSGGNATTSSPTATLDTAAEAAFVAAYGKYRRKLSDDKNRGRKLSGHEKTTYDDWHTGHDDNDTDHH